MADKRLVGSDGFAVKLVAAAVETEGNGILSPAKGLVLVTAIAAVSSGWPPISAGGVAAGAKGVKVGDLVYSDGASLVPAAGDKYKTLTLTKICDLTSFSLAMSKDEIDTTTLCDTIRVYRSGLIDIAGTISGIVSSGITDRPFNTMNNFLPIVQMDKDATKFDRYDVSDEVNFFLLINNKKSINGEPLSFTAFPARIFSSSLSSGVAGETQPFEGTIRLASGTCINPVLYSFEVDTGDTFEDLVPVATL